MGIPGLWAVPGLHLAGQCLVSMGLLKAGPGLWSGLNSMSATRHPSPPSTFCALDSPIKEATALARDPSSAQALVVSPVLGFISLDQGYTSVVPGRQGRPRLIREAARVLVAVTSQPQSLWVLAFLQSLPANLSRCRGYGPLYHSLPFWSQEIHLPEAPAEDGR